MNTRTEITLAWAIATVAIFGCLFYQLSQEPGSIWATKKSAVELALEEMPVHTVRLLPNKFTVFRTPNGHIYFSPVPNILGVYVSSK